MAKFIEVHVGKERRLVNLDWVEEIWEGADGTATIYIAFINGGCVEQDYIKTNETYGELFGKVSACWG